MKGLEQTENNLGQELTKKTHPRVSVETRGVCRTLEKLDQLSAVDSWSGKRNMRGIVEDAKVSRPSLSPLICGVAWRMLR